MMRRFFAALPLCLWAAFVVWAYQASGGYGSSVPYVWPTHLMVKASQGSAGYDKHGFRLPQGLPYQMIEPIPVKTVSFRKNVGSR